MNTHSSVLLSARGEGFVAQADLWGSFSIFYSPTLRAPLCWAASKGQGGGPGRSWGPLGAPPPRWLWSKVTHDFNSWGRTPISPTPSGKGSGRDQARIRLGSGWAQSRLRLGSAPWTLSEAEPQASPSQQQQPETIRPGVIIFPVLAGTEMISRDKGQGGI